MSFCHSTNHGGYQILQLCTGGEKSAGKRQADDQSSQSSALVTKTKKIDPNKLGYKKVFYNL